MLPLTEHVWVIESNALRTNLHPALTSLNINPCVSHAKTGGKLSLGQIPTSKFESKIMGEAKSRRWGLERF